MLLKFLVSLVLLLSIIISTLILTQIYYTDRHNHPRFHNLDPKCKPKTLIDVLKWRLTTKQPVWPKHVPVAKYDLPPAIITDPKQIRVTFVGHVTFLIQTNGLNILTDPVWAKRASPYHFIGPKRVIDPGIKLADLPKIDLILISHNHYDHMDLITIKKLWQRDKPTIITPLLNDQILKKHMPITEGKIITLNWYEKINLDNNTQIALEPSQHWSARGLFDLNKALWGNFIITTPIGSICFIGDSGYNKSLYKQIGKKYKIFLSMIPIGAFEPRWFMQDVHIDPAEAVLLHQHLQTTYTLASHFQTFPLASDGYFQPVEQLNLALKQAKIAKEKFIIPTVGGVYWFANK